MKHDAVSSPRRAPRAALALVLVAAFSSAYALLGAQATATKSLGIEDYARWRSINCFASSATILLIYFVFA